MHHSVTGPRSAVEAGTLAGGSSARELRNGCCFKTAAQHTLGLGGGSHLFSQSKSCCMVSDLAWDWGLEGTSRDDVVSFPKQSKAKISMPKPLWHVFVPSSALCWKFQSLLWWPVPAFAVITDWHGAFSCHGRAEGYITWCHSLSFHDFSL